MDRDRERERERERSSGTPRKIGSSRLSLRAPGRIHVVVVVLRGDGEAINQHKRCLLYYYIRCASIYTCIYGRRCCSPAVAAATPHGLLMDFAKTGNYNRVLIYSLYIHRRKPLILCQFPANWRSVIPRPAN